MIEYVKGNLLEAEVEAVVNTVNTVGVMGKGIALMFKERYPENMREYAAACQAKKVQTGKMFITETKELVGPKWIVNFPTKRHWRNPSKIEWVKEGLKDLRNFLLEQSIASIAIPPLGAGNGKLDWAVVKPEIEKALGGLPHVRVLVFEPTTQYQNVAKTFGVKGLTPPRAMIAELVRRYSILGMECSLLEIQKLAWFLERSIELSNVQNPLNLEFAVNRFGPYSDRLRHLLNALDGSYLHCEKRINDASPSEPIWFEDSKKNELAEYLVSDAMSEFRKPLEMAIEMIDGFESPYAMELLATIDWLISKEHVSPSMSEVKQGLSSWSGGSGSGERKSKIFDERVIGIALERLKAFRAA